MTISADVSAADQAHGPLLHRRGVGNALVRFDDHRHRLAHRAGLPHRGRGPGGRHGPGHQPRPQEAFDRGPWPRLSHAERAGYLRALGEEVVKRSAAISADVAAQGRRARLDGRGRRVRRAAHLQLLRGPGRHVPVEERAVKPSRGGVRAQSSRSRSAWSARSSRGTRRWGLISMKLAPALIAGCTVILKTSPEAPGRGLRDLRGGRGGRPAAGRAQRDLRADREVSELLVRDPGRQDHLHRLDRGRTADRLDLRRADRPGNARGRRRSR